MKRVRKIALAATSIAVVVSASVGGASTPAWAAPSPGAPAAPVEVVKADGSRCIQSSVNGTAVEECSTVSRRGPRLAQVPQTRAELQRRAARADKGKDRAAALAPPEACDEGYSNPDRYTSCSKDGWQLVQSRTVNGVTTVVGTLDFDDTSWASFNRGTPSWELGVQVQVGAGTGVFIAGTRAELTNACALRPRVCGNSAAAGSVVSLTPFTSFEETWSQYNNGPSVTSAGVVDTLTRNIGPVFRSLPGTTPSWQWDESETNSLWGRCDSVLTSTGCVDHVSPLILIYNTQTHPKVGPVAEHVYDAQRTLPSRWGVPESGGNPLSRTLSQADIDANRAVACSGSPPVAGTSCDEYPLATTRQGAAFVGPHNYSIRYVADSAQDSQGGLNTAFYNGQRVIPDDHFWVLAVLANGSRSW